MHDREWVIEGLEFTLQESGWDANAAYDQELMIQVVTEAIALLKAQEPHIVTIADYKNNPNVDKDGNLAVWRESRHFNGIAYHEDGWIVLNRDRVEGWFNSEVIRFWTSRPTDEQREATPWDTQSQREYEAAVEMAEYCERYEPTYNAEDGSM